MAKELDESAGWYHVSGSGLAHYLEGDESRCGRFKRTQFTEKVGDRQAVEVCYKCINRRRG